MIRRHPKSTLFPYPPLSRPRPAPTPILPAEELYSTGEQELTAKRYDAARENFKKIVERHPNSSYASRATIFLKLDRKSTRLNSSHGYISYAVFCLKKKKKNR